MPAVEATLRLPVPLPRAARRFLPLLAALLLSAAGLISGSATAQSGRTVQLVVLGDSLSAGFLIPASTAFPSVLQATLRARGHAVVVSNASVSGSTASDGLARVNSIPNGTDGVIVQLGANDRLRGVDPDVTRAALDGIVARLRARGIPVLLAGIAFRDAEKPGLAQFNAIYPHIARRYGLVFYPDFYAPLRGDPGLLIFDRTHPSPEGVRRIVGSIYPSVQRLLARIGTGAPRGRRAAG